MKTITLKLLRSLTASMFVACLTVHILSSSVNASDNEEDPPLNNLAMTIVPSSANAEGNEENKNDSNDHSNAHTAANAEGDEEGKDGPNNSNTNKPLTFALTQPRFDLKERNLNHNKSLIPGLLPHIFAFLNMTDTARAHGVCCSWTVHLEATPTTLEFFSNRKLMHVLQDPARILPEVRQMMDDTRDPNAKRLCRFNDWLGPLTSDAPVNFATVKIRGMPKFLAQGKALALLCTPDLVAQYFVPQGTNLQRQLGRFHRQCEQVVGSCGAIPENSAAMVTFINDAHAIYL